MDVRLPSLSSVVLSGFEGATRVKGAKPPKTAPSAVVADGVGSGVATKVKAPRAPKPPTTPNPPTSGDTP